jgi:hypothetical protein
VEVWDNTSVPMTKLDAAEIRRRAFEARLSSFSRCRSAREILSVRSGITVSDGVVDAVSEMEVFENDAELDAYEQNSVVEFAAIIVIPPPFCPDMDG